MRMVRDNITRTGARASGVEEITPRMAVHLLAILPDTVRELRSMARMREGRMQSRRCAGYAGCRLNQWSECQGAV